MPKRKNKEKYNLLVKRLKGPRGKNKIKRNKNGANKC